MPTGPEVLGISPGDLAPFPEDLARLVLIRARAIAPGILLVQPESELKKDALAILRAVAKRASELGAGVVASKARNGTSISFRDVKSSFAADDIAMLRSLFDGVSDLIPGMPRGSFPEARPLGRLWPEGDYS